MARIFTKFSLRSTMSARLLCCLISVMPACISTVSAQGTLQKYITEISAGGQPYYTPDAYSFYLRKGFQLPAQKSREEAYASFKAALKVGEMGAAAREAIPALLSAYPRAIHVTEINNVRYSNEGTFEDWVQTYVTGEKTKLLLSGLFFDYNSMSKCENFIASTYEITRISGETVTIPTKDVVNISVTHTIYFGACALSQISGENFGVDLEKWRSWWNAGPVETATPAPEAAPPQVRSSGQLKSGQLFSDIVVKGVYRMYLSTGDELEGRVEAKDDTSLILETTDRKAYTFRPSIIFRYEYLEPPKSGANQARKNPAGDTLALTYDELLSRQADGRTLEIRISSGMVFRGTLESIDSEGLKLKVGNSSIPIMREVVVAIRTVPQTTTPAAEQSPRKQQPSSPAGKDTVIVKNPETDDWGRAKPDFVFVGAITTDDNNRIVMTLTDGGEKTIPRDQVVRIVKNSVDSYETVIKRYAAPLFCPNDMFLVDLPPGKQGRPFFKVCVDRYEYPNISGTVPKIGVSFDEAKALCEKRGRRLCTFEEWQWACGGLEGYTYPYGWNPEEEKCNTDGSRPPEASGSRYNCVSKFGGYDMAGNAFEWVRGPRQQPSIMGGPLSKCQTITEGVGGSARPQSGFRCCLSN